MKLNNMEIHNSIYISNAILSLSQPDMGDIISNLKLQKLLYYAQGFNLALYKQPLFNEEIYAWQYGPVVPEVYNEFKKFGSSSIEQPKEFDFKLLQKEQLELLQEVYEVYGQYSALKLMNMTHNEAPWLNTEIKNVITKDSLIQYFSKLVNN